MGEELDGGVALACKGLVNVVDVISKCGGCGCWDVITSVVLLCGESAAVYQRVLEILVFCVGDEWLVWEEL